VAENQRRPIHLFAAPGLLAASFVQLSSGGGVDAVAFASIGGITAVTNKSRTGKAWTIARTRMEPSRLIAEASH
jgi:hypothetical protein